MTILTKIEERRISIDDINPAPYNPRKDLQPDDTEYKQIAGSLEDFGLVVPLVWNKRTGNLISGHQRLKVISASGERDVPCKVVDVDIDTEKRMNIALNEVHGKRDNDKLTALLAELSDNNADLSHIGMSETEIDRLIKSARPEEPNTDETFDAEKAKAELVEVETKPGDIIHLGPHRIICGDAGETDVVSRLMGSDNFTVCVTSPPYASQRKYDAESGFTPIHPDKYSEWFDNIQSNILDWITNDGSFFLNIKEHAEGGTRNLYVKRLTLDFVDKWGWNFVDEFAWIRSSLPGKFPNRFKNGWEPVFHFTRSKKIKFRPDNVLQNFKDDSIIQRTTTIVESGNGSGLAGGIFANPDGALPSNALHISKAAGQDGHGAAYPLGLPEFFIRAFSDEGDGIYDPFMGSGTTLIAAHQQGRICYGMELSPLYCDIICKRFEHATGIKAERVRK